MQDNSSNKIEYKTDYKDYRNHIVIMISTDKMIINERSAVRSRMIDYAKDYKELHIIVFSTQKYYFHNESMPENLFIYSTNSFSKLTYINTAYKIGRKILKNTAKTEKLLISCQDPFETGLVGKKLANLRNDSELLLQIHTDLFSPYFTSGYCIGWKNALLNKIRLFISKFILPHAQVIRVVSSKIADSLVMRGLNAEKIIIKPIAINEDYIRNTAPLFILREKFPQFKKNILVISRLESEKNIEMAIKAMKILHSRANSVTDGTGLIIVGSGSLMNSLKKFVYKLDMSQNVIFEGWQSDTVSYYKGCDIVLVTSWYEGYGMVLKEAQIAGKKIVSTDVGIAREVGAEIVEWKAESIAKILQKSLQI